MHLLLVNDDGIHAPGLRALCDAAVAAGHRVSICAPHCERSAASHSITLREPLRAERVDYPGAEIAYAATGTPADCARLGLYLIPNVDAVLSGINNGSNLGGACIYSGTVGAATEASMSGAPALAVSQCGWNNHEYAAAGKIAMRVLDWMQSHPLARGAIYNLNIPELPYEEILGVRAVRLSPTYLDTPAYNEVIVDGETRYAYTHGTDFIPMTDLTGDVPTTHAGYATLSKLTWDLRLDADDPDVSDIQL